MDMRETFFGLLVALIISGLCLGALLLVGYSAGNDVREEAIDAGVAYYTFCGEFRWKEME